MKKLYIGNLSYQTKEETLEQAFAPFGTIQSINIVRDRYTGRPRGFCFIEMEDDSAAEKAVAEMNGKEVDGRELVVNEARPQTQRDGGGRGDFSGGGGGGRGNRY